MSPREVGDRLEVGDREAEIRRIVSSKNDSFVWEVSVEPDGMAMLWKAGKEWGNRVRDILGGPPQSALPELVTSSFDDESALILVRGIPSSAVPFEDGTWREIDRLVAVESLQLLARAIGAIHDRGASLHGIKRRDLYLDEESGRLYLAAMPRLRMESRPSVESVWRDIRLLGELTYENFLGDDYPGGHQMAEMLQDRTAMADTAMFFPGLPQLLAGCVSPYGDLAYLDAVDVREGLEQIRLELQEPILFDVGAASTVGNYIFRKNNQDSCGSISVQSLCGSRKISLGFFCVADGIGGIQDGERASRLAVHTACEAFGRAWTHYGSEELMRRPGEFARDIAKVVGQRLAVEGEFHPEDNRGGTTFSGLLVAGDRAAVCHVGDSRIVLARDDQLTHLTQDHTLANILVALGELTEEEAEANELSQRTISRFLSTSAEVEHDRIDGFHPKAAEALGEELGERGMTIRRGDLFLLTSDGAHGEIGVERLRELLDEFATEPQDLCEAVVNHALEQIGRDNSTILALRIV